MPEYSDLYVISDQRTQVTISDFLDRFLPKRVESADEYEVPQFSSTPDILFESANDLIEYCSENKYIEHAIYWRALEKLKPEHAMVFFLQDGYVIYGLSTDAYDQIFAQKLLAEMKDFFDSPLGYIGHEASPDVNNFEEFQLQMELHTHR